MLRIDLDSSLAPVHHLSLAWYSRLGTNYIWRLTANTGIRGLTHVMSPWVSRVPGLETKKQAIRTKIANGIWHILVAVDADTVTYLAWTWNLSMNKLQIHRIKILKLRTRNNRYLCYFETKRRWLTAVSNPAVCRIPRLQIQMSDAPDWILQLMHAVRAYCRINAACLDAVLAIAKANNAIQFVLCLLHVTFHLGKNSDSFVMSFFGITHIEIKMS